MTFNDVPIYPYRRLTKRQLEIGRLAASDHKSNREIACELGIKEKTVKNHLTSLYDKLPYHGRGSRKKLPLFLPGYVTEREKEILKLAASGRLNKQIAYELGIEERTVKNHLTSAYRKLHYHGHGSRIKSSLQNYGISSELPNPDLLESLTEMDWNIIEDVSKDLRNGEIAAKRHRSKQCVSKHLHNIYETLKLDDGNARVQLVNWYKSVISHELHQISERTLYPIRKMLPEGFEPSSQAREARILNRTRRRELIYI